MAKDPVSSLTYEPDSVLEEVTKRPRPILDWILLYENGSSTTRIARRYDVGASTVRRRLVEHISLRDRISASIIASTKFVKKQFSCDPCEGAFLAGFVEDCHVRQSGRLKEVSLSTTHPAMQRLFHNLFANYGHLNVLPHFEGLHGYYQYIITVYLDPSFEPFVSKTEHIPHWVPLFAENPIFQSYLSGLVAAEGCILLYDDLSHADTALTITLKKRTLLEDLSTIIGGRIYEVERAFRLVVYGKAAARLMSGLNVRHQEKVEKRRLVMAHLGEPWVDVEPLWQALRRKIMAQVLRFRADARLDYIQKHGSVHYRDTPLTEAR